jgi:hypothetical protein
MNSATNSEPATTSSTVSSTETASPEPAAAAVPGDMGGTVVYLGNREALEVVDDPADLDAAAAEGRSANKVRSPIPGKQCTTIRIPAGVSLAQAFTDITSPGGVWAAHSNAAGPAWVATDNEALSYLLSAHYKCERREPDPTHQPSTETGGELAPESRDGQAADAPSEQ